jgi:hypothetical protein
LFSDRGGGILTRICGHGSAATQFDQMEEQLIFLCHSALCSGNIHWIFFTGHAVFYRISALSNFLKMDTFILISPHFSSGIRFISFLKFIPDILLTNRQKLLKGY